MRERLIKLGGRITVDSEPDGGTRVTGVCPLKNLPKGD
jgi:signal transduction histidine kinase